MAQPATPAYIIPDQTPASPAHIIIPDQPVDQKESLPKHVCFKGDNGMYLSARIIDGAPYLQFSSGDIGDPSVRHTVTNLGDGIVCIKSDTFDRFWRRSPNWIWADSDHYSMDNLDTLFQVVKLDGNKFALKNLGNGCFCHRLTLDGKESCLNATVPFIRDEARLHLEEAVLSRRIYGVEYHLKQAKIYGNEVLSIMTKDALNETNTTNKATMSLEYEVTKERKWESSVSMKLGVTTTIEAGVPEIASAKVEVQTEITDSYTWGETNTRTEKHSDEYEVTVPPHTRVVVHVISTKGTCEVPFSYYQEDILTDGQKVVQKFDDGIYRGVNSYDIKYEATEHKL